ncbi:hypothetical protein BJX61DRAFT_543944 [Aspergillus egyptiacus]|nr:hypothetical protein BJX61DRAFT_543944 [Aspergillus egyptiacus]
MPRRRRVSDPEVPGIPPSTGRSQRREQPLTRIAPMEVELEVNELQSDHESEQNDLTRPEVNNGAERDHKDPSAVVPAPVADIEKVEEKPGGDEAEAPTGAWEDIPADPEDKSFGKARQKRLRTARLSHLKFHDRLAASGIRHLYAPYPSKDNPRLYRIALSTLQRMVIHDLQRKLVLVVKRIYRRQEVSAQSLDRAQELLAQYTAAIRDYDFMTEKLNSAIESGERDLFTITTEDALSLYLMKDALLVPKAKQVEAQDRAKYRRRENILPGSSRSEHNNRAIFASMWTRIWMGVCGGIALIAPMLLMVLQKDETTALATTTVATMLFAVGLAILGKDLKGQEVLASVAAYAAVLVVFVGASS